MREIGNDLHTLKKSLKGHEAFYGEWGPLLRKRFSLNYKTAQNYMYYSEAADWAEGKGTLENFSKLGCSSVYKLWRHGESKTLDKVNCSVVQSCYTEWVTVYTAPPRRGVATRFSSNSLTTESVGFPSTRAISSLTPANLNRQSSQPSQSLGVLRA